MASNGQDPSTTRPPKSAAGPGLDGRDVSDSILAPLPTEIRVVIEAERRQRRIAEDLLSRERALRIETEEARVRLQEFLGMVAHDLRAPLGVVAASLELLGESRPANRGEVEEHVLPATVSAVRRMGRLVEDLLGAARIGAGSFRVHPLPMDLVDVARHVIEQHRAPNRGHRLSLEAPERLEGEWDRERVGQLLTNLVSNAIKYSPDGGDVRVAITPTDGEVIVRVSDQGAGLDPTQTDRLFQPFVRLHREPEIDGLGLGLYIARGIAEAHGGRIWAESQSGQGTSFFVALPLAVGEAGGDVHREEGRVNRE